MSNKNGFFFAILIFLYFNITLCDNSNSTKEESEPNFIGNGYKCRDKLSDYKNKFSLANTIILGDKNYTNYVQEHGYNLIYFHSACNDECTSFIPAIKFVSDYFNPKIKDEYSPSVVSVDLSDDVDNRENQIRFPVQSLPFVVMFNAVRQKYVKFNGILNAQSLITFVLKQSHKQIYKVNTTENLDLLTNPQLSYFSVLALNNYHLEELKELSNRFSFVLFGDCSGSDICRKKFDEEVKYDLIFVKMKNYTNDFVDENNFIIPPEKKPEFIPVSYFSFEQIRSKIAIHAVARVHNFTDFSAELMFASYFHTIFYIKGKNEKKTNKEISLLLEKAIDMKKSPLFWGAIIDPLNSSEDKDKISLFGLDLEEYEKYGLVFALETDFGHKVFRMDVAKIINEKEINEKLINEFVIDYGLRKIKPDIKSENTPKSHPRGNLRMVVGKTFNKEVLENNNRAVVLCLLTMNLTDLQIYEKHIDEMTYKLEAINDTLTFGFIDVGLNYIPDLPEYNSTKNPYYRYYYKNKSLGYVDYVGNYKNKLEVENWIAMNYAKEFGEDNYEALIELMKNVTKEIEQQEEMKKVINEQRRKEMEEERKKKEKNTDL